MVDHNNPFDPGAHSTLPIVPVPRPPATTTGPAASTPPVAPTRELIAATHNPVPVTDTREGYLEAVARLAAGTGPLAVDAERASGFRYSQRAYLIQVYREGAGTVLFDPPAIGDFAELQSVIGQEEWVLHAASQDLACLREVGLDPARIFDTELAARLLGLPRVGLGAVVADLLGIHLEKAFSAADWSTRPLPEAWLTYAALDVELLIDLRRELSTLLDAQGKQEIARQEFEAVLRREQKPPLAEPWRKLSGVHAIRSPRLLATARELWLSRDEYAREVDTAPGRLLPDRSLLAAVQAVPESKRALLAMRDFSGRASRSQGDRWWAAIERARALTELPPLRTPSEGLPQPRLWPDRNPAAHARLSAAKPVLQQLADEMEMPGENLLTPDFLRRLAWEPPEPLTVESIGEALTSYGARAWQVEAVAESILAAFVDGAQNPPSTEPDAS